MDHPFSQLNIAELPTVGSARFFDKALKRPGIYVLTETILVTITAVLAIKVLGESSIRKVGWLVTPCILIATALIPTLFRKNKLADVGFNISQARHSLVLLSRVCIVVFPALFAGLWLLRCCGLELSLWPVLAQNHSRISWLFYQFMYVAVAEEMFFRAYVQTNIMKWIYGIQLLGVSDLIRGYKSRIKEWISIGLSAAVFAVAHIIITGQIISALTFLPGLILGWLFIRTKSLLAPVLFHGLANVCYFYMLQR